MRNISSDELFPSNDSLVLLESNHDHTKNKEETPHGYGFYIYTENLLSYVTYYNPSGLIPPTKFTHIIPNYKPKLTIYVKIGILILLCVVSIYIILYI
jgi:hypothetical protein